MPHEAFAALTSADREELVQLAALLSAGDGRDAGEVARAALVAAGRSRPSAEHDLVPTARQELVRRALGPAARDREEASGWAASTLSAADADGFEVLRRELALLPARTRTALVLGRWAGWSEQEIAAALRTTVDAVRTEIGRGAAAVRTVLHPASAYRRPVDIFVQPDSDREVRDALDGLARSAASSATPLPFPDELRRDVARARRRWWLGSLAAACTAALLAVAVLVGGQDAAPPERPRASERPADPRSVDITDLPTRGSLADDAAFLAGLRELAWVDDPTARYPVEVMTMPESRQVLFAGDVPGGRWALLVGRPGPLEPGNGEPAGVVPDELLMAWFVGPPGAGPEQMTLGSYPYGLTPGMVPGRLDPRTGTLVVVAAPGDSVEVSQRVDIGPDGQDTRSWTTVDVDDEGIGVASLDPVDLPWTWSAVYRVLRDGQRPTSVSPDGAIIRPDEQVPELAIDFPVPPSAEGRLAARYAALGILTMAGLSPDDVEITAQALVPLSAPAAGTVALVTVTLPSGAVAVTAQWILETPEGLPGGSDCGMEVRPAGSSPEDAVLAARCELYDPVEGRGLGEVLIVRAPPQVDRVRLYRGDSSFLAEHPMPDDGVLVVPRPDGASAVEAVTDSGVLLGRTEPLGRWTPAN